MQRSRAATEAHSCYSTTADAQRTEEVPCSNKLTSSRTEQHSRTPPLLLHSRGGKEATKKTQAGSSSRGRASPVADGRADGAATCGATADGRRGDRPRRAVGGRRTGAATGSRRAANGRRDRQIRDGRPQKTSRDPATRGPTTVDGRRPAEQWILVG